MSAPAVLAMLVLLQLVPAPVPALVPELALVLRATPLLVLLLPTSTAAACRQSMASSSLTHDLEPTPPLAPCHLVNPPRRCRLRLHLHLRLRLRRHLRLRLHLSLRRLLRLRRLQHMCL